MSDATAIRIGKIITAALVLAWLMIVHVAILGYHASKPSVVGSAYPCERQGSAQWRLTQ